MKYIGEHLLIGQLGHLLVVLSFVAALYAFFAMYMSVKKREQTEGQSWLVLGRWGFIIHGISTLGSIALVFTIMLNRYYEYFYAWDHVSDDLPFKYIFSAFWEGQEGSFFLWSFWHIVLGFVILGRGRQWEAPVIAVLALVQAWITSMVLGIYLWEDGFRVGIDPFRLLRHEMDIPIFSNANYLEMVKGNGLNPLLQNYWMTIHPPTLFLGFASTTIPFCFAIAGLWLKEFKEWLRPALPWALFSGAILGIGILMGGAWAYEALSFGGYWAWDPVENMSLVPWLTLVAGIHTNLISKATGHGVRATFIYYLLTMVLVLYSTFLTRSGILGDSSVHAFTEMGMEWQLVGFVVFFLVASVAAMARYWKGIPVPAKEESTSSKEFWLFVGTLVLAFSAILITVSTSLPVWNKIVGFFNPDYKFITITDVVAHHNKYQLWIGVFIGVLSGFTQYLRFREKNWQDHRKKFLLHLGIAAVLSTGLTLLTLLWIDVHLWQYFILLFAGTFGLITNADYLITFLKGNLKPGAAAISHMGFGIMLIGILASGLNKKFISTNTFLQAGIIEGFTAEDYQRNILLPKGVPVPMSGYEVTYLRDTMQGVTRTFDIQYRKLDKNGNPKGKPFLLHPNVLYSKEEAKIAASNPSTKRYLNKDIFTHVASLPRAEMDPEFAQHMEDSLQFQRFELGTGDTAYTQGYYFVLEKIQLGPKHPEYKQEVGDFSFGVQLRAGRPQSDTTWVLKPMINLRENVIYNFADKVAALGLKVRLPDTAAINAVFATADEKAWKPVTLRQGESITYNGYTIQLAAIQPKPTHTMYKAATGDIAAEAQLEITNSNGKKFQAHPVMVIREKSLLNIPDLVAEIGLQTVFSNVDPSTGVVTLQLAGAANGKSKVPIDIADNAPRGDYIVLQAIEFPGINLFWTGSLMMLIGLLMGMFNRMAVRRRHMELSPQSAVNALND